ncbi:hypothetical protein PENTCL1PPCAC_5306, partial [Pristionchus entomophagus]
KSTMLCVGESIPFDYRSMETGLISPMMSQHTESSGESSPEQPTARHAFPTDTDDTCSLLDGPTPVPSLSMIHDEDSHDFAQPDFQISTTLGGVYSDYYDRIREDADWNELGQMSYIPLYTNRTSHGSFSSDRMSSEGSVSPSLPSPIGEHLKTKRDSSSSVQFPIVAGAPQPFPEPFADRVTTRVKNFDRNGDGHRKPYTTTIMEPKAEYEYGSSSQDSLHHAGGGGDVFGGSQESLNGGYGGSRGSGAGSGYGRQDPRLHQQQMQHNGGGRMAASSNGRRQQHYSSNSGYGNNTYNDYGSSNGGYGYDQSGYDNWRAESFESTNKYGGPIISSRGGGGGHASHYTAAAAAAPAPSGPLPTAFSRANINDLKMFLNIFFTIFILQEQKNNLMANLARLCNQRSY